MTYVIIHSNPAILEESIINTINKHLNKDVHCFEEICKDPDFCIVEHQEQGNIKIEQIKQLQKKLLFSPFNKTHQFGIIKDAHLMTTEAQNALLKTLEECNENTVIILTINNEGSVLQTILSRCNRIYPNGENLNIQGDDFFSQEEFLKKPVYEKINDVENIIKDKGANEFLENLTKFFRKKYTEKIENREDVSKEIMMIKKLEQAKYRISKNVNAKIALEYICFKIDQYF